METIWDRIANPTCLYLDYLEYKAACARNGVYPVYSFAQWRHLRTSC